ncbi:hypothetical protein TW65_05867 [Stemphylium lycopersici]|uniref:BTB domain-containing protein n=1 Tax=Stemphylium lycopersici TaxID=183478 RepID=A0A364NEI1_STELY|nr:hypothetical protein TW65_05867 [Stemphylium lycopersici]RAR15676.1 hypothetical protein DDE83_000908 [Stemphylium lycopersici]
MAEPRYSFEELIQSDVFTFYVGEEKKEFSVHSKAIAATSRHFHALVNNGMTQSLMRTVEYPDMDSGDFARFVEYAYRQDYTVPPWIQEDEPSIEHLERNDLVPKSPPSPPPPAEPEQWREAQTEEIVPVDTFSGDWGSPAAGMKKKKAKKARAPFSLRADFDERNYLTQREPKTLLLAEFEPQPNTSPDQDFTPVFLAHARMYTFACMRLIDPLKRLALHKLHRTFLCFQAYERRVGDVVELAKYAYQQGEDRKDDGTIEPLRKLVVDFMVREVSTFADHKAFTSLLHEGGEFVVDFWRLAYKEHIF